MIYGNPWTNIEETLLLKLAETESTLQKVRQGLLKAGYQRSHEAIARKLRRLKTSNKGTSNVIAGESQSGLALAPQKSRFKKEEKTKWVTGSLDLVKDRPTKFIMINDVHVPHNIPLDNIWEFASDFQPDYMLLVGDIVNNDPFDHWAKAIPRRFQGMPQPKEYYEECNESFYRPMREAVGKECTTVHWVGNHEYWSNKAIGDMPEGEGYWEVWNNVENIDLWVPSKQIANLGHLHFLHGDVINGGRNHSAKMMNYYRRNIRYGHYHNIEESSHTSPIDVKDRHTARCCGTLEEYNPEFMANRPHDWQHAFTYGIVLPDGNFWDHTTTVIDNKFYANGALYGQV